MSALPAEVPPSGAVPAKTCTAKPGIAKTDTAKTDTAKTDTGPRGRSRAGGAQARPSVHPLFPSKRWVLPDGDCIFPGGGDRFSGQAAPRAQRPAQAPRPADAQRRPDAQRPSRPRAGIRVLTGPAGRKAGRVAGGRFIAPAVISQAPPASPITSARHATVLNRIASADRATPAGRAALASRPAAVGQTAVVGRATPAGLAAPASYPVPARRVAGRVAGTVAPRRLRLTRRGRIVVAILAPLAVCGLFVAGASAAQASGPAEAHGNATQVTVQPGDTLWSIAQSADPNADARAVVQQILQANRLTNPDITAGQRLWVPRG